MFSLNFIRLLYFIVVARSHNVFFPELASWLLLFGFESLVDFSVASLTLTLTYLAQIWLRAWTVPRLDSTRPAARRHSCLCLDVSFLRTRNSSPCAPSLRGLLFVFAKLSIVFPGYSRFCWIFSICLVALVGKMSLICPSVLLVSLLLALQEIDVSVSSFCSHMICGCAQYSVWVVLCAGPGYLSLSHCCIAALHGHEGRPIAICFVCPPQVIRVASSCTREVQRPMILTLFGLFLFFSISLELLTPGPRLLNFELRLIN